MPDGKLVASTVDVFTPVVDDPYTYGLIAAANSLSDIYAMGGVPRFALSVLAYPPHLFSAPVPAAILQGAIDKCHEAGAVLAGGHTLRSSDFLFGLAVTGEFPQDRVLEKGGGRPGDALVITKPLGTGVLTTALKRGLLSPQDIEAISTQMASLNDKASRIGLACGATACTDVTGFGLLGHLLEMCDAGFVRARLRCSSVPLMARVKELASRDIVPGGTRSNLQFVAPRVTFAPAVPDVDRLVLADAQTSGGLLLALPNSSLQRFLDLCAQEHQECAVIGEFVDGAPGIDVEP